MTLGLCALSCQDSHASRALATDMWLEIPALPQTPQIQSISFVLLVPLYFYLLPFHENLC